jgi:uncharacterized peroxidase-related enzyme
LPHLTDTHPGQGSGWQRHEDPLASKLNVAHRDDFNRGAAEIPATLEGITRRLGWTPNLFRLMALSPNSLAAFVSLSGTLSRTLDVATIESMGLAVSGGSGCRYCAQSHVFLGTWLAKLDMAELELNRRGGSSDPKRAAAVRFAKAVTDTRGKVSDEDLVDVRAAGFSDADIVVIAGLTAQFPYTNFMSNISQPALDFPAVALAQA